MIKDIITYPTPLSVKYATDVRLFDTTLFSLIEDLKDTITENNLKALAAFQIGDYHNVIVIKQEDDSFLELVNPRLIGHSGSVESEEVTAYYPGQKAKIKRYEQISVVYQDRDGKDNSLRADGELAIIIQRKLDYTFGATYLHRMDKEQRERFETALEYGVDVGTLDYCPTTFQRDKITKVINIAMIAMVVNFIVSFFVKKSLWSYQLYASYIVLALSVVYFFYAQYEGKKYTSCTSCQIGNIIGTTVIIFVKLSVIMGVSFFFMKG